MVVCRGQTEFTVTPDTLLRSPLRTLYLRAPSDTLLRSKLPPDTLLRSKLPPDTLFRSNRTLDFGVNCPPTKDNLLHGDTVYFEVKCPGGGGGGGGQFTAE